MRGSSFECQRHMNVSNYVFDPCMVLLASKAPLLVFRLWPSGAITHGGPSSHSSSLSAQLFSQRSFLGQIAWTSMAPFPQIYWFTANLSIIHIPNYRLQSAGWRQQHKEGEEEWKKGKDMLSFFCTTTSPGGSKGFALPLCRAYRCSCSKRLCRARCLMTPTSLSVKCSTVATGWGSRDCTQAMCCAQNFGGASMGVTSGLLVGKSQKISLSKWHSRAFHSFLLSEKHSWQSLYHNPTIGR